ncbi:hypothetical protein [Sporomusa sp.]|uniref:hypothetical protein n=1 Tax=Sporomusa sp. TaxID=2078658 RepID=UPI002CA1CD6E|nr:hypothetical protein [Sporomusa sp.]HWR44802.1 hypothetical protein [Sporomusa sp.]
MLMRKIMGCNGCIESSSCEFSSEFCPKAALDLSPDNDLAADPVLRKYRELYQRLDR